MLVVLSVLLLTAPFIDAYKLRIFHTNDMHARYEQTSRSSGKCFNESECVGGFARVATAIKKAKETASREEVPLLVLNAGDTFQGTMYYTIYKWRMAVKMINLLKFDAMSLGNHEFDDGVEGLIPFVNNITSQILACNLNVEEEPGLKESIHPSTIIERGEERIGIIGYLTPETAALSNTGKIKFNDEISSINNEASKLRAQNVKIIIAVGHSGYDVDKKIAEKCPDVDIVVGGHSHSFLYTGNHLPDNDEPVGPYPTEVIQKSGRMVIIVQAYAFTKYFGEFTVTFDKNGEVTGAKGQPVLLDGRFAEDEQVVAEIKRWKDSLNETFFKPLGETRVSLNGSCRFSECNFGNLITDAFVDFAVRNKTKAKWAHAAVSIINGGAVRVPLIEAKNGLVTREDLLTAMPFFDSILLVEIEGKYLKEALEWSVFRYDKERKIGRGEFLQFSGLRVEYDLSKPPNYRVVKIEVKCANCSIPKYEPFDPERRYRVISRKFLQDGGDNYTSLSEHSKIIDTMETDDTDILAYYIEQQKIIYPGLDDRIKFSSTNRNVLVTMNLFFCLLIPFLH